MSSINYLFSASDAFNWINRPSHALDGSMSDDMELHFSPTCGMCIKR